MTKDELVRELETLAVKLESKDPPHEMGWTPDFGNGYEAACEDAALAVRAIVAKAKEVS